MTVSQNVTVFEKLWVQSNLIKSINVNEAAADNSQIIQFL